MKEYSLWVDQNKPPSDQRWLHIKDFKSFSMILDTINFNQIKFISFGKTLDSDEDFDDDSIVLEPSDCALYLIDKAKGKEIPQCVTHTENTKVVDIIDHYSKSYGFNKYCARTYSQ